MNLAGIDLRLLRSFLTLSKAGSYVRAAQTLHISQPALSQQMADLSNALGVTLFEKVGRRSMLTETGRGLARGLETELVMMKITQMWPKQSLTKAMLCK